MHGRSSDKVKVAVDHTVAMVVYRVRDTVAETTTSEVRPARRCENVGLSRAVTHPCERTPAFSDTQRALLLGSSASRSTDESGAADFSAFQPRAIIETQLVGCNWPERISKLVK